MDGPEHSWNADGIEGFRDAISALPDTDQGQTAAAQLYAQSPWLHLAQLDLLGEHRWRTISQATHLLHQPASPLSLELTPGLLVPGSPWKSGALSLLNEMLDALRTKWSTLSEDEEHIVELFLGKPDGTRLLNKDVAKAALSGKPTDADRTIRGLVAKGILIRSSGSKRRGVSFCRQAVTGIPKKVLDEAKRRRG